MSERLGKMIILTGHQGFIGTHFKRALWEKSVYLVEQDTCYKFLKHFDNWDRVTKIIYLGAISSTTETNLNKIHNFNTKFSTKLFKKAIKHQIPVKYASSASVYGNSQDRSINPLNYYALSKATVDYWVQDHMDEFKSIQGFRFFNVYGRYEDRKGNQASPVSKFTKEVRETGQITLFEGSDNFYRDFVCVSDVYNLVMNNNLGSGIYDIGTGSPVSFQYVANMVAEKEGGEIQYVPFPDHLKGKYQNFTKADMSWIKDYQYVTIPEYLQL
jgi:ADP-L-glycero-D-manno-heptose 6-epimerase